MLDTIFNIALIVLGFGILIFFHELGHFLAAKWAGIRTQAFAVGMGPHVISWRKGIGVRVGSTAKATERKVHEHLQSKGVATDAEVSQARFFDAMDESGLGETEYSLRWLPIGGFVSMVGQEDVNPQAVSDDPRSYQNCPVGRRMVVVSAGVIANLILAVVFFVWAFLVGVPFEAPVVGGTDPDLPAANVMPVNAQEAGVTSPGLQPGDEVVSIDGQTRNITFQDLAIAAAMGRPDESVHLTVDRRIDGETKQLHFNITPQKGAFEGLLSFGIVPARSNRLFESTPGGVLRQELDRIGLSEQGVVPGMELVEVEGHVIRTFQGFEEIVRASGGEPVRTLWRELDDEGEPVGSPVAALLPVQPRFQQMMALYEGGSDDAARIPEEGLIGLTPLVRVEEVSEDSLNRDLLQKGDVFVQIAGVEGPRMSEFYEIVRANAGKHIAAKILRGEDRLSLTLEVSAKGQIGIRPAPALDLPLVARPITDYALPPTEPGAAIETAPSPVHDLDLWAQTRLLAVNDIVINDWVSFRAALLEATQDAAARGESATVELTYRLPPTVERFEETATVELDAKTITDLHDLGWTTELASAFFEPITVILDADGNPITAVVMGFEQTWKFLINTYLTIDRLIRGTVGVEQLRGPVGIVHLGTQIADRGLMYLVFFLAMISVNLAVINFLPLPIVDGGLFLFLIYEKIKGQPPSLAFQNAATVAGLLLIVSIFVLVTYNDIARLITG